MPSFLSSRYTVSMEPEASAPKMWSLMTRSLGTAMTRGELAIDLGSPSCGTGLPALARAALTVSTSNVEAGIQMAGRGPEALSAPAPHPDSSAVSAAASDGAA
jgi:hypothetical protein